MSLVLMFFITYAVVLAIALVFTAVLCPRESSLFVTFKDAAPITAALTFVMAFLILNVFVGAVYIWGNMYYPQHCHGCGELITDAYYQVDEWRWHPGCFTKSTTYHSAETPSWQFPPEQEAPSDPAVVNSPPRVKNTVERISGTVEGAQVKFNSGGVT